MPKIRSKLITPAFGLEDWPKIISLLHSYISRTNIILLKGNLGAGKTTFVKQFCRYIGLQDTVVSPTFSLISEYTSGSNMIYHMDLYRIEHSSELEEIGIWEYIFSPHISIIEWPEIVEQYLDTYVMISFTIQDHALRQLILTHYA